jgi:hypothetical protein
MCQMVVAVSDHPFYQTTVSRPADIKDHSEALHAIGLQCLRRRAAGWHSCRAWSMHPNSWWCPIAGGSVWFGLVSFDLMQMTLLDSETVLQDDGMISEQLVMSACHGPVNAALAVFNRLLYNGNVPCLFHSLAPAE